MADGIGNEDLRTRDYSSDLKGFALQKYTLIEDLSIASTPGWVTSYYRETATALAASGTQRIRGGGRGSEFPTAKVTWALKNKLIESYRLKDFIPWEDHISDNIDVTGRTLLRIAEGVVKAQEDEIFQIMTVALAGTGLNSTTTTAVGGDQWDAPADAGDPPADLLDAMRLIAVAGFLEIYKGAGFLWINPYDYQSLLIWVYHKGAQAPKFAEMILADGRVQQTFMGLKVRVSNSVTVDYALVGISKTCGTWQELQPLQVYRKDEPGEHVEIKAFQYGATQLTTPTCMTLIDDLVT